MSTRKSCASSSLMWRSFTTCANLSDLHSACLYSSGRERKYRLRLEKIGSLSTMLLRYARRVHAARPP